MLWLWVTGVGILAGVAWALWPSDWGLVAAIGRGSQRVCLRARLLGVRVAVEGRYPGMPLSGGDSAARAAGPQIRLRVTIGGLLRWERRYSGIGLPWQGAGSVGGPEPRVESGQEGLLAPWQRWRRWLGRSYLKGARVVGFLRRNGWLRRFLMVRRLRLRVAWGFGDAAATGWATAALWAGWGQGLVSLRRLVNLRTRPVLRVYPVYAGPCFRLMITSRISLRQGWLGVLAGWWIWDSWQAAVHARRSRITEEPVPERDAP